MNLIFKELEPRVISGLHPLDEKGNKRINQVVHKEIYRLAKKSKRPVDTGAGMVVIYLSPLDYREIPDTGARTRDLAQFLSLIPHFNSLFLKKISLLRVYKFPVNFVPDPPSIPTMSPK